jgi:hypothetical protein
MVGTDTSLSLVFMNELLKALWIGPHEAIHDFSALDE